MITRPRAADVDTGGAGASALAAGVRDGVQTAHVQVAAIFNLTFAGADVHMVGGGEEPAYSPAAASSPARLLYTRDHASSALHEAAHWCLAGRTRRQLPDFGYPYVPAGQRDAQQQRQFEASEVQTQAIEWFLSLAAGVRFHVSLDQPGHDCAPMQAHVLAAVSARLARGLPRRARCLQQALATRMGGIAEPVLADFLSADVLSADFLSADVLSGDFVARAEEI